MSPRHPALAIEGATSHLRLRRGADAVTLRVFADPQRSRRVYLRAGELGITHVEPAIPAALVPAAAALRSALERGEGLDHVFPGGDGTVLEVLRATFDDQRLPRWPASMRTGPPRPTLWPYDAELAGLVLGRRQLIRREWLASDDSREIDERWLASNGLRHEAMPAPDGRVVVLASRDAGALALALELEPLVERPSPRWEQAAAQMGELLGYPPCCIATFVAARARDDGSLFAERLPPPRHAPLPPETLWLDAALALVSHAPCDPSCPATLALARDIRASLGDGAPGWDGLAARVHAITRSGRVLAIAASGTLADGLDVVDATEIVPSGATPELRTVPVAPRLTLDGWALEGLGEPCTLFSDHRGARSEVTSFRSAPSMAGEVDGSPRTR